MNIGSPLPPSMPIASPDSYSAFRAEKIAEAKEATLYQPEKPSAYEVLNERKKGMTASLYSQKGNIVVDVVEPLVDFLV